MNFKLKIWRQRDAKSHGKLVNYDVHDISPNTSFLEMLDILNENLLRAEGNQSRSTLIAAKEFAAPARSRLTAKLTDRIIPARCASFICESFATVRPS